MNPKTAKDAQAGAPEAPEEAAGAVVADPGEQSELEGEGQDDDASSDSDSDSDEESEETSDEESEDEDEVHWIGIELKDSDGNPVPGEDYLIKLPDGTKVSGWLDDEGKAKVENITQGGNAEVSFPRRHKDDVQRK